ncbi:protoporphyrinogen oxidase HemJ [Marinilongibacter aquaticus]|uniref:protoporphyrinogen oxidase HemJ n=1 Tax=Marinilongibacter aquaticus TaxID=2975157 RepID=UPI0021BD1DA4|nr:protoporphyrinogen oxidase HemJ [Marinilongibacter aquaticus]UBM58898.1 protoporphyrinogen oxidase HemJ [Marinilongibacter aquaticus]
MAQYYLYFKAFHIVGFVSWFAGLFYLVRIFVYHAEAEDREEPIKSELKKQFSLMSERVYKIIMNPAMMITWTCGLSMLAINPAILDQNWIRVKLLLLVLLTAYHLYCKGIVKKQLAGISPFNSYQFRLLNELPTLFLVAIVLLAVIKDVLNFAYLFLGVLVFGFILFSIVKAYKRHREKKAKS